MVDNLKIAIIVPVITFILGWGSGVITAWAFYKELARRIGFLDNVCGSNVQRISKLEQDVAVLYEKVREIEV